MCILGRVMTGECELTVSVLVHSLDLIRVRFIYIYCFSQLGTVMSEILTYHCMFNYNLFIYIEQESMKA